MLRIRTLFTLILVATIVVLVIGLGTRHYVVAQSRPAPTIVGSWVVVPIVQQVRTFVTPNLITFSSDGTFVRLNPFDSGAVGVWTKTGDRTVAITHIALRTDATPGCEHPANQAPRCFIGTTKVRGNLTLSATGDEYAGSGTLEYSDAQGKIAQPVPFTNHGTRIKVESP